MRGIQSDRRRRQRRSIQRTLLLLALPFLWACQTVPLSDEARREIRAVRVDPYVEVPHEPEMTDQGIALMGLVGLLAAEGIGGSRENATAEVMEANRIDIGEMVRSEFTAALARSGIFSVTEDASAPATIRLEVDHLGMHRPMGFTWVLKPMIAIVAVLENDAGEVLWRRRAYVSNLDGRTPAYSYGEYEESPEKLREVFDAAIGYAVDDLIDHLREPG